MVDILAEYLSSRCFTLKFNGLDNTVPDVNLNITAKSFNFFAKVTRSAEDVQRLLPGKPEGKIRMSTFICYLRDVFMYGLVKN